MDTPKPATPSRGRYVLLAAGAFVVLGALLAVPAFACTPQAGINVSPNTGEAGVEVEVRGYQFHASEPIQVHWQGRHGPVLANTETDFNGNFAAQVTIPADASAGDEVLVARQADNPGEEVFHREDAAYPGGSASAAFMVEGPDGQTNPEPEGEADAQPEPERATPPEPEPAQDSTTADAPEPDDRVEPPAAEDQRQQIGDQRTGDQRQQVGDQRTGDQRQHIGASESPIDQTVGQPTPTPPADVAPDQAAPRQPTPAEPAPTEAPPTEEAAASESTVDTSRPLSLGPDQVDRRRTPEPNAATSEAPSSRSATADLWSGVASPDAPSLRPQPGHDAAADPGQTGPGQLAVGVALFGAGLAILVAGAGMPALRRRRALPQAHSSRSA